MKILGKDGSLVMEIRLVVARGWGGWGVTGRWEKVGKSGKEGLPKDLGNFCRGDGYFNYLDHINGFMGVYMSKQKCAISIHVLLYFSHISIKLLKTKEYIESVFPML